MYYMFKVSDERLHRQIVGPAFPGRGSLTLQTRA